MLSNPPILLIDTNVWVDYYLPDQPDARASKELILWAIRHDVALACPSSAVLDVYRKTGEWLKRWMRKQYGVLTEEAAIAIKRIAWDNANEMQEIATPIPVPPADFKLAAQYRDVHNDLEDDLVAVAALRAKANYLVTNDKGLIKHSPVCALTPANMLLALKTGKAQGSPYVTGDSPYDLVYEWLSKEELGVLR